VRRRISGTISERLTRIRQPAWRAAAVAVRPEFQSVRQCKIQEEADGLLINADTKQPFAYTDACVVHGVHTGHDPLATQQAKKAVEKLLKRVFELP
jgi:hypothetical protein